MLIFFLFFFLFLVGEEGKEVDFGSLGFDCVKNWVEKFFLMDFLIYLKKEGY